MNFIHHCPLGAKQRLGYYIQMTELLPLSDESIANATSILRAGGLVAFPTETVYGLAGNARDPLAIRRIYATKGRPAGHPRGSGRW